MGPPNRSLRSLRSPAMTIALVLTFTLWSSPATSPSPDSGAGGGDRSSAAGGERDEEAPGLEAVALDGVCLAFIERSGGAPWACPIARVAHQPRRSARPPASLLGITSHRSRRHVCLRC
jgi:hypothetical protein